MTIGDATCIGGNTVGCDDNCIDITNATQADPEDDGQGGTGDGVGSACDNCPIAHNPDDQRNPPPIR